MAENLHNWCLLLAYLTGEEFCLSVSLDCGVQSMGFWNLGARNNTTAEMHQNKELPPGGFLILLKI